MAMKTRTSWKEKLQREARVIAIPPKMQKRNGKGTILIPCGMDVDAVIRKVPRGKLVTQGKIRETLAHARGADMTCPIVTGMMVRLSAEAAEEDARAGKARITPYWRVVRDDGSLLEKLPGGPSAQADRLSEEGHMIDRGGKLKVKDHARVLAKL